ncbi:MAG: sigma-54 dependent transcriptional regulator [Actinomycetota bacterium]|nr:sigma-54 dependent transcriptional regulator [Actinomycetota bacterium]
MTKILVLDDEDIVLKASRRVLESEGYAVETTASPENALSVIESSSVDIVLSDLRMPGMDGLEFLKKAREISPETEVIIITGQGTIKSAVEALKFGAYDFIEKPLNPDQLKSLVARCLERKNLLSENRELKKEVRALYNLENVIGRSAPMQEVFELVAKVSRLDTTVLIEGQSGTGKELVARAIHYNSPRRDGPFVVIDCVTIPENLMESELFGHVKGSFTGAGATEKGLVELARGGTLFFDEIGNLPETVQVKLLRLLQEKEFRPVGSRQIFKADSRIIAATNANLQQMAAEGKFREDLYYRLNVFPIKMPPLSLRKEDIPALVRHFIKKHSAASGRRKLPDVSVEAMSRLVRYDWPGNVRELENSIQRALIMAGEQNIDVNHVLIGDERRLAPASVEELKQRKKEARARSAGELEKSFLIDLLTRNGWNVTRAAADAGMERTNFHAMMKKHRIKRPEK